MVQILMSLLRFSPIMVGMVLTIAGSAIAAETVPSNSVNPQVEVLKDGGADRMPTDGPGTGIPGSSDLVDAGSEVRVAQMLASSSMAQVTSVSELSDVQPTDWAFQALQSLVERYGCIEGYPDGTFRGNRALTRYEFAAGLNACLDRVNELIAAGTTGLATKEDLATLQRLQEEFAAELATLRGRVDALEARTTELEANQFSTTTKLDGQIIFAVAGVVSGDDVDGSEVDQVTTLGHRTRLNLETSFTGRDLLLTRLQADNLGDPTDLLEGDLFYYEAIGGSDFFLDALLYAFPIGEKTRVSLIANAGAADDVASTVNFLDGDGATGALSVFGTRNSIYYLMDGTGAGITHEFGDFLEVSLGYLASDPANPGEDGGLFNGPYGALAQVVVKPSERLNIGFTFIHSYNNEVGTGSLLSNPRSLLLDTFDNFSGDAVLVPPGSNPSLPFGFNGTVGDLFDTFGFSAEIPISTNAYGIELSWQVADRLVLGGWAGYMNIQNLSSGGGLFSRGSLDAFTWAANIAVLDLINKGDVAGIIFGMEPRVVDSSIQINPALGALGAFIPQQVASAFDDDADTSFHIEAFYQYQLTDNIAITPGIIWITAPDHNSGNDDLIVGTIRTTFSF